MLCVLRWLLVLLCVVGGSGFFSVCAGMLRVSDNF